MWLSHVARNLNISQYAILHLLQNEPELKLLKFQKVQNLTNAHKEVRLTISKELLPAVCEQSNDRVCLARVAC